MALQSSGPTCRAELGTIYKSKRTETPEDIEQIDIINNRVKNDKLF